MMSGKSFFFAGGGTGGHIYPAIALAEQIVKLQSDAKIHFFVSTRNIDTYILSKTNFKYTQLPAKGFSLRPGKIVSFCTSFFKSCRAAKKVIAGSESPLVVGVGGFVAAPACCAAHKLGVPIVLLNVDFAPGRANKFIARWADEIFVQFEDTAEYFARAKAAVSVVGCPLRSGFAEPQPDKVVEQLDLDESKKILLVTGASSGSENINRAICSLLDKLSAFAEDWQIVHLAGWGDFDKTNEKYANVKIGHKVLRYFDDMPNLLAAADLVVGRSGAVSVAEYATAAVPSICMPYPYHKDRHQYLNAGKLSEAGAGVIVEDLGERSEKLWQKLEELMRDNYRRQKMLEACKPIAKKEAAGEIAKKLLGFGGCPPCADCPD
ncbi:MAG: UDP-N-acetylglucosamine--N-acetylmuramyl-(pentapeptide) pyrophosphoryl-undecaprenol N-acetylglucosamine transferase [Planctomycetota bacterium]|jgi:UDP-N-acetylglucosamine--N-acetylmuramyl-(pentapeptide) pyrophosphoryl-undecaprenol N-acetylglucosamine transferase